MCCLPFFVVLFFSVVASYFAARRKTDYFLANRSLKWPMLMGTFIGAQIGGGFILGNTEEAFQHGIFGSMYGLGIAAGMLILGLGFGAKLRNLRIGTLPELLRRRYGSSLFHKIATIVSILSLTGGLLCQAIGLNKFLLAIGHRSEITYFVSWGSVVLYTSFGGMLAVVWTDTIQALIMIAMLVVVFISGLVPQMGEIVSQAEVIGTTITSMPLAPLLFPLCFIFVQQDMAQRCFAAQSSKHISIGCIISAVIMTCVVVIPTCCGILGRALGLSSEHGAIFMQVMQRIASPTVVVMASSAVLLAIVSTVSALLLALSSNVSNDLCGEGRGITFVVGGLAMLGPYLSDDIIGCLVLSYEISVGALLVPIIMAVLTKKEKLPKEAAIGAALLGSCGIALGQFPGLELFSLAAPLALSPLGFFLGSVVQKKSMKRAAAQSLDGG